jgi:hypothetical protein
VRRWVTCVIAFLAAFSVFIVLATPAFDELPSTAPHSAHSFAPTIAVTVSPGLSAMLGQLPVRIGRVIDGTDLLLLTCSRLC